MNLCTHGRTHPALTQTPTLRLPPRGPFCCAVPRCLLQQHDGASGLGGHSTWPAGSPPLPPSAAAACSDGLELSWRTHPYTAPSGLPRPGPAAAAAAAATSSHGQPRVVASHAATAAACCDGDVHAAGPGIAHTRNIDRQHTQLSVSYVHRVKYMVN